MDSAQGGCPGADDRGAVQRPERGGGVPRGPGEAVPDVVELRARRRLRELADEPPNLPS